MSTQGKKPMTFAGILKLMYAKKKTGVLSVRSPEAETKLHFDEGRIVTVEIPSGKDWPLGDYLIDGGTVSQRRVIRALKLSQKRDVSPEQVLVDKKYVSVDVLRKYVDLHTREFILPLFGMVGLRVALINEHPKPNPWLPPMPVPFLLKEGERRTREWPVLQKRIPSAVAVYKKDPAFLDQIMRVGDETGNPIFSDKVDPDLGAHERIVYYYVNGKRPLRQVARTAGLDLFSTYRAMYTLQKKYMVKLVNSEGQDTRKPSKLLPVLSQLFWSLVIVALVAGLVVNRPGLVKLVVGERSVDLSLFQAASQRSIRGRVLDASKVLYMQNMACPEDLTDAIKLSFITESEARNLTVLCNPKWGIKVAPPR